MITSSALEQFLAAYRHRSLGKASREIGVSQPALSKTVRRLEDELKVSLFERTSSGIEPTEYGHILARRAGVVQNEIGRALDEIRTLRDHQGGELRFGAGPALAASFVPAALASYLTNRPQTQVFLIEGLFESLADSVLTARCDFAVTTRPSTPIHPDLTASLLFADDFVFAASFRHPLARKRSLQLANMIEFPWVLAPRGGILWPRFVEAFERAGLRPPRPQVETSSSGCMVALLRAGSFLSLVPSHLIEHEVNRKELAVLNVKGLEFGRDVIILRRALAKMPPGADAFLRHLTQAIKERPDR